MTRSESSVLDGFCGQTDTQTRVTTIHFSWSTIHAKCNYILRES